MSYDATDERADRAFLVGVNYGKAIGAARIVAAVEELCDQLDFDQGDLGNDTIAIRDASAMFRSALREVTR